MSEDRFARAIQAAARARAGQAAEIRSKNLQPAPSMKPAREEAPQPVTAPIKSTAPAAQATQAAPVASSARLFRAYRKPAGGYEIAPSANASLPAGAKPIEDAALHAQLAAAGWAGVALYSGGYVTGTAPAS
ncbi:hypothetical protein ABB55_03315 [Prosthecomicrobium hirschii]|uniref:Uncharacterized protein n=1 Tax=Prosthecodimorpha hirschii TaxID=665126 RepID=A0A0P6VJU6_9HYPH|nr:hypothetical protein [Prosthecomicrobium hirschii]KPL51375.1 hypothetical protein ABB55_03315 [Prosthecomicrobium hirschii]